MSELPPKKISFEAIRFPQFRFLAIGFLLTMMADNVEHVVSYWVIFQKFHSNSLGGFAVISHWIPYLLFSLPAGMLAERKDPRRLIQLGLLMFIVCSGSWAYLFITDNLQLWMAMVLLILHGLSGVFWTTATQIILYDIVEKETLPSAVRTLATARYMGLIVGPGVGAGLMVLFGPKYSLFINCLFYLPNFIWLINAPHKNDPSKTLVLPFQGFRDLWSTFYEMRRFRDIFTVTLLAGGASFFIANSYHAQMPSFADDLGHGNPGLTYSFLLASDALGALTAGLLWEYLGYKKLPSIRSALIFASIWAFSLGLFSLSTIYYFSVFILFIAGFSELTFNTTAQTIMQLNAPQESRGRLIGLFNMASMGLKFGSGIFVGLMGSVIGTHWSLVLACGIFIVFLIFLNIYRMRYQSV
jgi:MFS family permease